MTYTYQLVANSNNIIRSDGATIPADPSNSDYAAYQKWIAANNVPTPAPAPSAAEVNAPILLKIAALEDSQHRAVREFISGNTAAQSKLQTIDSEIVTLRSQLVK